MCAKNILLIGGTKFIGPYVVNNLINQGHHVSVYHRGQHETAIPESVRHFRSDKAAIPVCDFPPELFALNPEIVMHMIPMAKEDSEAALQAFSGQVERMVWLSSGDVYQAYGRFMGLESGPADNDPLTERSPLRTFLYPYGKQGNNHYEKILVEQVALSNVHTPGVVLRLPKVYSPAENADLSTIYSFRHQP